MRTLTAEVGTPPVLWLTPCMGTLAGVLSKGGTWTRGAATKVLNTCGYVHVGIHQDIALSKGGAKQDAVADVLLGSTEKLGTPGHQAGLSQCLCGDSVPCRPGQGAPPLRNSFHPPANPPVYASIYPGIHPSVHPPICPPTHPSAYLPTHPFIYLATHPPIHLFIHPFVHPPTCPCIHPSIHPLIHHPLIHPSFHPPISPSIHPSTHPPVHLSIHLSILLYTHSLIYTSFCLTAVNLLLLSEELCLVLGE